MEQLSDWNAAMELTLTIRPPSPRSIMCRLTSWVRKNGARKLHGDDEVPGFLVYVEQSGWAFGRMESAHPSGVDENIDVPEELDRGRDRRGDRRQVGQIDLKIRCSTPSVLDLIDDGTPALLVPVENEDIGPRFHQHQGGRPPDPRRSAGDDGALPPELLGH